MAKRYTQADIDYMKQHYPNGKTADIAKHLNRRIENLHKKAASLGIKKTEDFFYNTQLSGRMDGTNEKAYFKKGNKINLGRKMCVKTREALARYWYKQETKPHNTHPVGTIVLNKKGYYRIKTSDGTWEYLAVYNWKKAGRTIPENYNIIHKDGNKENCKLENLKCISKGDNMRRNWVHDYPEDLKKAIKQKNKLKNKLKKIRCEKQRH